MSWEGDGVRRVHVWYSRMSGGGRKDQRVLYNNNYRPQTKLREGNVFTPVCHSVRKGGLCPGEVSVWGSLSRGVSVPACTIGHMTRWSLSRRVPVRGGFCPRGLCPG